MTTHEIQVRRDRARAFAAALNSYADRMQFASRAREDGDERSAALHEADARAELHVYPQLLDLVVNKEIR